METPKRLTQGQMQKVGVTIVDSTRPVLRCGKCGAAWSPDMQRAGRMPRGYWKCPNGCNSK